MGVVSHVRTVCWSGVTFMSTAVEVTDYAVLVLLITLLITLV